MHIVVQKNQAGRDGEQADQQTADVVLVVFDRPSGGGENAVELEQHEKQNERTGHEGEADIAQTLC